MRIDAASEPRSAPVSSVGAIAEAVAAVDREHELEQAAERSLAPIVIVDAERRYVYANGPARLAFHLSLAELRARRVDDLTPPRMQPRLEELWRRLRETGFLTGTYEVVTPDGGSWEVTYYAVSARVPERHVVAFSPAGWPENELNLSETERIEPVAASAAELTDREREVVELLAHGLTGEEIAARLQISRDTVRTHIRNALRRMGAKTRPHLVALVYGVLDSNETPR